MNWFKRYKYAFHYLDSRCYWISPSGVSFGGMSHLKILMDNFDILKLEKYGISEDDLLDANELPSIFKKLEEAGFMRIYLGPGEVYIDLENPAQNTSKLEDIVYQLNPAEIQRVQINSVPAFKLETVLNGEQELRDLVRMNRWAQSNHGAEKDMADMINGMPDDWKKKENREDFVRRLHDVMEQFAVEQKESFLRGEVGILGYNHFVIRPGATELSPEKNITPDSIVIENIERFGDFPVVLVWEGKAREVVPASKFISLRNKDEFSPIVWSAEQNAMVDEYFALLDEYKGTELPIEIKQKLSRIQKEMETLPHRPYLRYAFVDNRWKPGVDTSSIVDRRELVALEELR